tara:strand:- start:668 stop:1300 length:633 start_codon:yes stop_codon:yes gene_type:complete
MLKKVVYKKYLFFCILLIFIVQITGIEEECISDIKCGEWGECDIQEKINEILNEELDLEKTITYNSMINSYKERTCVDLNECLSNNIERESCNLSTSIEIKRTKWCNEDYIEIYDADSNKLVVRIKGEEIPGFNKIDISFITDKFQGYCNYCFDGIKNYDEKGIDCGGSCSDCINKIEFSNSLQLIISVLWIVFALLLILFMINEKRASY